MKRLWFITLVAAACCAGCTSTSLERYTLDQIRSSGEFRNTEALNCLAAVAADPNALPSMALIADGITHVQDMVSISPTTTWTRAVGSFATQSLGVTTMRSPQGSWDIDPVVDHPRLEALRCACQWVLYGRESLAADSAAILLRPDQDPVARPHFAVAEDLARLPRGWLHVGRLKDVPPAACAAAHCCDVWVWVLPDGMEGLADFTLVLHAIMTLDASAIYAPPVVVVLSMDEITKLQDVTDPKKRLPITTQEVRVVRPECIGWINQKMQKGIVKDGKVDLTWADWMRCTVPYHGMRTNVNPAGSLAQLSPGQGVQVSARTAPAILPRGPEPLLIPNQSVPAPQPMTAPKLMFEE